MDHLPVTYIHLGQTYKNRYCAQCNIGKDVYATFWDVSLVCKLTYFSFRILPILSQYEFADALVFGSKKKSCNIVYESQITSFNETFSSCVYNNMIDTCKEENSNDFLRTLCRRYYWPIEIRVSSTYRLFNNYACLLCNGVAFRESCKEIKEMVPPIHIQLTAALNSTRKLSTFRGSVPNDRRIINRYFPNKHGEVHCKKGFVYDARKVFKLDLRKYCFNLAQKYLSVYLI